MKKLIFLLSLLAIISCDKTDPDNPYNAQFNSRGCLECDNYTAGETFMIDGVRYEVVDRAMLEAAIADGEDLSRFCTSRIGDMDQLFYFNETFNQDISSWDVSNVTTMYQMFDTSKSFNKDIGNWDVSSVVNMQQMFSVASSFNKNIGNWDVSNVTNMDGMFFESPFNQNLNQWCVSNITSLPQGFSTGGGLSAANHPVWGTCP